VLLLKRARAVASTGLPSQWSRAVNNLGRSIASAWTIETSTADSGKPSRQGGF
jgi:hypothetical protein